MNTPETPISSDDASDAEPLHIGAGFDFSDPNSPLAPYYCGLSHIGAVAFLAFVFLFFGVLTPLAHTDIWGHLKYGEWIVKHHSLPDRELFSDFSDPEQPYWNFQWLSQATLYLVYHAGELLAGGDELRQTAGGVEMLRSFHGLLIVVKIAFLMLAMRRLTKSLPLAIAGAVLVFLLTMAPSRILRPQVYSEVLFAILIWWMSGVRLSRFTWLALPVLLVAWANCHGSFAIGYLFLGLFCFGRVMETWWTQGFRRDAMLGGDSWLVQGSLALVITPVAVGILNPHGFELMSGVLQLARHPNIHTISEWSALNFSETQGGHWIFLVTLGLIVLSQVLSPRPLTFSQLIVMLVFVIGPLYQQRMLIWWLMLVPWFIAPLWKNTLAIVPRTLYIAGGTPSFRKTLIAGVLGVICLTWSGFFQLLLQRDPLPLTTSLTRATPWRVAFQLKHGVGLPPLAFAVKTYPKHRFEGRIFAQDSLADYLLWALSEKTSETAPDKEFKKAPILVYNHAHVFPEEVWQHQIAILSGGPGWTSLLDRYQVNMVIIDPIGWPKLAANLREDTNWNVILDEATSDSKPLQGGVANTKSLIAVRKMPL
jgi:hypothetical protein